MLGVMRGCVFVLLTLAAGCASPASPPERRQVPAQTNATNGAALNPFAEQGGDWTRPARDLASSRYSDLDAITAQSVSQLGVKATFSTGVLRGHEAAPIVADGTMFVITPFPNI